MKTKLKQQKTPSNNTRVTMHIKKEEQKKSKVITF